MASMYTVYLGIHDATAVFRGGNLSPGGVKVDVSQVITVIQAKKKRKKKQQQQQQHSIYINIFNYNLFNFESKSFCNYCNYCEITVLVSTF